MKQFLLLFRGGNPPEQGTPEGDADMKSWMDWISELQEQDIFKGGLPLQQEGMIVDKSGASNGVFGADGEVVGGYLFITAESLEEAAEISKGSPALSVGGNVEVRETIPLKK